MAVKSRKVDTACAFRGGSLLSAFFPTPGVPVKLEGVTGHLERITRHCAFQPKGMGIGSPPA